MPEKLTDTDKSTAEREHLTYLRLKRDYDEFCKKRKNYNRISFLGIIVSGIVLFAFVFGINSKIRLLGLWVVVVIFCVVVMLITEYKYNWYREILGIDDKPEDEETTENKESGVGQ